MADISRADVASLIQDGYASVFNETAAATSQVLAAFPTVSMGTKTERMPVLATLPHAKWVGETAGGDAVKPTAQMTWGTKEMVAEELAVIIPIHENVIDDASVDLLSSIAARGGEAIARALDAAVLFGTAKPATWTSPDLFKSATDAGQVEQISTTPGANDLVGSIFQAAGRLDDAGYAPSTFLARAGLRYQMANLRATDGTPIYLPSLATTPGAVDNVAGMSGYWFRGTALDGSGNEVPVWDPAKATAMVVDRERVRIGVRQDITVKFLDQATVGGINLAENDMVALRFKARYAYVLGDMVAENATAAVSKSPVAVVTPAATV